MAEVTKTETKAAAEEVKTASKPSVKKYICVTKCYWRERLWKPGDTLSYGGEVPEHFNEVK